MVLLVRPNVQYKESYLQALDEYHRENRYLDVDYDRTSNDFAAYVEGLLKKAEGQNLPEGYVPETKYWLVDNDEFIGHSSIRHTLTDALRKVGGHIGYDIRPSQRRKGYGTQLLHESIAKAEELGITDILVTCDATNIGLKKIIESNGGILENQVSVAQDTPEKLHYWIRAKN